VLAAAGCENPEPPPDYVARVGQSYLTRQDLQEELRDTPAGRDSADARQQVIERWVTNELLYQEALRKGLIDKKEVQRLLEENKRSVLISALISSRFESDSARPSPTETRQYYERHRQQLALREPYVRVRHLATPTPDSAQTARSLLQQAMMAGRADSTWPGLARRFAHRPVRTPVAASPIVRIDFSTASGFRLAVTAAFLVATRIRSRAVPVSVGLRRR